MLKKFDVNEKTDGRKVISENLYMEKYHTRHFDDRSFSTTALPEFSNCSNNCQTNKNFPFCQFLPSYCYDIFDVDKSESSEQISFTDIKLANLHSKLKAETEEIRKWKQETIMKKKEKFANIPKIENTTVRANLMGKTDSKNGYSSTKYDVDGSHNFSESVFVQNGLDENTEINFLKENNSFQDGNSILLVNNKYEYEIAALQTENTNLKKQLDENIDKLGKYKEKINTLLKENESLNEMAINDKNRLSEMKKQFDMCSKELQKYRSESKIAKLNILTKELENIKEINENKESVLNELKIKISNEISEKDNAIKENVRLKELQMELKNQMIHLLTFINASKKECGAKNKIINEFQEEHEKLSKITANLKALIEENKKIFKGINGELVLRNEKLMETTDHVKFLEDKLNSRESQYENLKNKLEILYSDFKSLQISSKNIRKDVTDRNNQLMNKNLELSNQIEFLGKENLEFMDKMKNYQSELIKSEKSREEILNKFEKLKIQHNDTQNSKLLLEDRINSLNQQIEVQLKKLEQKDEKVNEIHYLLKSLQEEKMMVEDLLSEMEMLLDEYSSKIQKDYNCLENRPIYESMEIHEKIKEFIIKLKHHLKLSEEMSLDRSKTISDLENQIMDLKQQKAEIIDYLYKLPTSSLKWTHFFP